MCFDVLPNLAADGRHGFFGDWQSSLAGADDSCTLFYAEVLLQ
jgi:hypothetical protein